MECGGTTPLFDDEHRLVAPNGMRSPYRERFKRRRFPSEDGRSVGGFTRGFSEIQRRLITTVISPARLSGPAERRRM